MSITKNVRSGIISGDAGAQLDLSGTDVNIGLAKQPSANGVLAPHKNLSVFDSLANVVIVDAEEIVVTDSSDNDQVFLTSVNPGIDITVSGANGLDTGTEAADTWYHIWIIWNGTTSAGLLSLSSTAPTMPSGYTHKGLVGAIFNDSGSDFIDLHQLNTHVVSKSSTDTFLTLGTDTTFTSLSVPVPTTARAAIVEVFLDFSGASAERVVFLSSDSDGTFLQRYGIDADSDGTYDSIFAPALLITAQTLWYRLNDNTNVDGVSLTLRGWMF